MRGGGGGAGERGGGRPRPQARREAHCAHPLQSRSFVDGTGPEGGGVGSSGEEAGLAGGAAKYDGPSIHLPTLHPRGHHLPLSLRGGLVQTCP